MPAAHIVNIASSNKDIEKTPKAILCILLWELYVTIQSDVTENTVRYTTIRLLRVVTRYQWGKGPGGKGNISTFFVTNLKKNVNQQLQPHI